MNLFEARRAEFEEAGAQVLGVSVDSYASQGEFQDKLCLNFPLLSDFPRNLTSIAYDTLNEERGLNRRVTIVIDRDGVVRGRFEDLPSPEAHVEEAFTVVSALK